LEWFAPYLTTICEGFQSSGIEFAIDVHVTKEDLPESKSTFINFHANRPDPVLIVQTAYKKCEEQNKSSIAVVTCGPPEMMRLTANATSSLQGKLCKPNKAVREVYLVSVLSKYVLYLSLTL
jgi:NAD(P)H-flavin reductase